MIPFGDLTLNVPIISKFESLYFVLNALLILKQYKFAILYFVFLFYYIILKTRITFVSGKKKHENYYDCEESTFAIDIFLLIKQTGIIFISVKKIGNRQQDFVADQKTLNIYVTGMEKRLWA